MKHNKICQICSSILFLLAVFALAGCDTGFKQMGTTEYGIKFRKLPPSLGGGIADKVIAPGELVVIWPWDGLYKFDTKIKYLSWGAVGKGSNKHVEDYVYTRAFDGNEVALAVTVQYRISNDPKMLKHLILNVARSNIEVEKIVKAVARADIRTYMNELKTAEFFDRNARYRAIDKARDAMNKRLNPDGIIVEKAILDEHRFERLLRNGKVDRSYQDKIDETQKLGQDRERELLRIDTIKAKKEQEYNQTQAEVNREVAQADGFKNQSRFKGNAYYEAKNNRAEALLAKGKAEAEGLKSQIAALQGIGGRALLKLEIAKNLSKNNPKFVVVNESTNSNSLNLKKMDTNRLLDQIGLVESLREDKDFGKKKKKKLNK